VVYLSVRFARDRRELTRVQRRARWGRRFGPAGARGVVSRRRRARGAWCPSDDGRAAESELRNNHKSLLKPFSTIRSLSAPRINSRGCARRPAPHRRPSHPSECRRFIHYCGMSARCVDCSCVPRLTASCQRCAPRATRRLACSFRSRRTVEFTASAKTITFHRSARTALSYGRRPPGSRCICCPISCVRSASQR
jgi:hypothetical protein